MYGRERKVSLRRRRAWCGGIDDGLCTRCR